MEESHSMDLDLSEINPPDKQSESFIRASSVRETVLTNIKNVKTRIVNHEKISGGMFAVSYVNYTLDTMPTGWSVKRRYSDFSWLRSRLVTLHPGYFVPPLPEKQN